MRGSRAPRGLTDRVGKIEGEDYTGDPDGVVTPWGGTAGAAPVIGSYPVVTIPIDEDDDGSDTMDRVDATPKVGRKSTRNTTKARHRKQLKTLANWIAMLSRQAALGWTDGSFVFNDDFVGGAIDTGKWTVGGNTGDASVTSDSSNGGMGALVLAPATNGHNVFVESCGLNIATRDFIFATRFRFEVALDTTKGSFQLGLTGGFWLESNSVDSRVYLRIDGGGVFPANAWDTGLVVTNLVYHTVVIKRLRGVLSFVVDGVETVIGADSYSAGAALEVSATDTTGPVTLAVDYVKCWVAAR